MDENDKFLAQQAISLQTLPRSRLSRAMILAVEEAEQTRDISGRSIHFTRLQHMVTHQPVEGFGASEGCPISQIPVSQ